MGDRRGTVARETDLKQLTDQYMETVERAEPEAVHETYREVQQLLEAAAEEAREELAAKGIEVEEIPVRFDPHEYGSIYDEEDREIVVGQFTQPDRHYVTMNLGHEMLHQYICEEKGMEAHTPREEAVTKLWDLYSLGVLNDRERCEELLESDAELYDASDAVADDFGSRMYEKAERFMDWLEHDFDGEPQDGMGALLRYVDEFYFQESNPGL